MRLTESQQTAVTARGNVLVVAGAGTGKTRTLVERCLNCLVAEKPRASLDEILMVTFTEAAAAEMRQRIRSRLEEEQARAPGDAHWREQLALFETAHIGTLHSFCLELIRQHFYLLELDPQLAVMPEEESRMLADETIEALLQRCYAGKYPGSPAVLKLIQSQAGGWDEPIRKLVLRLHNYTQTLPTPSEWFARQLAIFAELEPTTWRHWLAEGLADWRSRWVPELNEQGAENQIAARCAVLLESLQATTDRDAVATTLAAIQTAIEECPHGKKTRWVKPLHEFVTETEFLYSIAGPAAPTNAQSVDPLVEDWGWVRPHMTTLLELARTFSEEFTQAKRETGMVDFHDLEQYALQLLWDTKGNQPTPVAVQWREKLRFIFVDEYQDINAAQDKIIEALSRPGAGANRFLVGDIKQSIYRFRLANPHIFQSYIDHWGGKSKSGGAVIPLTDNFRSREGLLDFVNSLFELTMRADLGGVLYDDRARLRFGAPADRSALAQTSTTRPAVELHVRIKRKSESSTTDSETDENQVNITELEEAAKEARQVALRLIELRREPYPVWDEQLARFRPADWRDMAILLRSPSNKAESYAKEFARLGLPLELERGGFYNNAEILDLLSLLQVLDNPLQDLPLLAVLHSPLVGLTQNELAAVRVATNERHFWNALVESAKSGSTERGKGTPELPAVPGLHGRISAFLDHYARWRRLAREVPLSRCLETILMETNYAEWLLTQARGEQRRANLQRLLGLAQEFDQFQRQGLFRFLRFIEAQQTAESEPEVAATADQNAVRLMSIHQSKGLEYPIVVLADTGKPFNMMDLRAENILDEIYGLCPQVRPPQTLATYPSLPHWLARRRQQRELLGEELRLLYVAATRARDLLILSASVPESRFEKNWQNPGTTAAAAARKAGSFADWLAIWFSRHVSFNSDAARQADAGCVRWTIHDDVDLVAMEPASRPETAIEDKFRFRATPKEWQELEHRLSRQYPFATSTSVPAKTSVSRLRRQATEETATVAPHRGAFRRRTDNGERGASAAETGLAHHRFLQFVALNETGSVAGLKHEAKRLQGSGVLAAEEVGLLNFEELAQFWNSALGLKLRAEAQFTRRELEFTARFAADELACITGSASDVQLKDEFVVVQGIADLAVIRPQEIWLLDFKTDAVQPEGVHERAKLYEPQLQLYARALSRIYHRPVTECWLYFLMAQQAVAVSLAELPTESAR